MPGGGNRIGHACRRLRGRRRNGGAAAQAQAEATATAQAEADAAEAALAQAQADLEAAQAAAADAMEGDEAAQAEFAAALAEAEAALEDAEKAAAEAMKAAEEEEAAATTTMAEEEMTEAAPFTYKLAIFSDPTTDNAWAYLDTEADVWNQYVLATSLPSLYGLAFPSYTVVPNLAADVEPPLGAASGDNWVIDVNLRQGLVWSDGSPITANDVAFTFNAVEDLQMGGNWFSLLPLARDDDPATEENEGAEGLISVEVIDDHTVRYTWSSQPGLAQWQFGAAQARSSRRPIGDRMYPPPAMPVSSTPCPERVRLRAGAWCSTGASPAPSPGAWRTPTPTIRALRPPATRPAGLPSRVK